MKPESTDQSHQIQQQKRGVKLTIIGCLALISLLLSLFFHKITTPRYLSDIELRINGLVLEPSKSLSMLLGNTTEKAIIEQLLPGKWSLLVVHSGACHAVCIERMVHVVSMLDQLKKTHRDNTQLVLIAEDAPILLAIMNKISQDKIVREKGQIVVIDTLPPQTFEAMIDSVNNSAMSTAKTQPKVLILDDNRHYRGYFAAPFDQNKMLLTYSSLVEHH